MPILEREHHVVGGERVAVGPLRAFAQGDGQAQEIGPQLEALGQIGHHRSVLPDVAEVAAALGLLLQRVPRLGAGHEHVDRVAVGANRLDRLHHRRFHRQPVSYRRQRARRHQGREHRRFRILPAAHRCGRGGRGGAAAVAGAAREQARAGREQRKSQDHDSVHWVPLLVFGGPGARTGPVPCSRSVTCARRRSPESRAPPAGGPAGPI